MKWVLISTELKALFPEKGSFLDRAEVGVLAAASNDEVLRLCREQKIDLIVTQLDLPGMRCEDLFGAIRSSEELKRVSTVILCPDTLANRERCKNCGPSAVVFLPIDTARLHLAVQQFLDIAQRMDYRVPLAVAIEGTFKTATHRFWTVNISASGMLMKGEEPLEKGSGIFFSFFLPGGAHVTGYGEITRVEPRGPADFLYGVRFTNIAPAVRSAIEAVVGT